jgi:hypothetical protein
VRREKPKRQQIGKKELETGYVSQFAHQMAGAFPSGEIYPSECPDFVVDDTLGIEVTQYFRKPPRNGRPMQEQESMRHFLLQQAQIYVEHRSALPLFVSVEFDESVPVYSKDVPERAAKLGDMVLMQVDRAKPMAVVVENWANRLRYPAGVRQITVSRAKTLPGSLWTTAECGTVSDITPVEIETILARKNRKYFGYDLTLDAMWLLIVANGAHLSSSGTISDTLLAHPYESMFDRIFLFQFFEGDVWELRTK